MSRKVFHYVRTDKGNKTLTECGVALDTHLADNWSEAPSGVSCKKCIAKMEKAGVPAKPKEAKKYRKDRKAIKLLKKIRKHALSLKQHISAQGTKDNIRFTHASELHNIICEMLGEEKDGWTDLNLPAKGAK